MADETTKTETQAQTKTETDKPDPTTAELAELRAYRAQVEAERTKAEEERARKAGEFESLAKQAADRAAQAEARAERAERGATLARLGVTDDVVSDYAIHAYERLPTDKRPAFDKWAKEQQKDGILAKLSPQQNASVAGTPRQGGANVVGEISPAIRREAEQAYQRGGLLSKGMSLDEFTAQYAAKRAAKQKKG